MSTGGVFSLFEATNFQPYIPFLIIVMTGLCLVFNKAGRFLFSRIFFLLGWTFLVSFLPVMVEGPNPATYFFHPFYIIIISPVIHLLFSHPKDRFFLIFFLAVSCLTTFFSMDFLLAFDTSPNPTIPLVSMTTMKINFMITWLFINLLMAYVLKTNWEFYHSLHEQKELIASQRLQLQAQNEEMSVANQELINLNAKFHQLNEALEHRVAERTSELIDRNKKLSEYAYMNAHLLRSPVSSIKGLINLFSITEDAEGKKKVQEVLLQSAEDLDKVVRSISEKLNEAP